MDWKDTVMSGSEIDTRLCDYAINFDERDKEQIDKIVGHQAGLSFKAGYKYAQDAGMEEAYEFVKREGIKEVVEFFDKRVHESGYECAVYLVDKRELKSKLKEWGL